MKSMIDYLSSGLSNSWAPALLLETLSEVFEKPDEFNRNLDSLLDSASAAELNYVYIALFSALKSLPIEQKTKQILKKYDDDTTGLPGMIIRACNFEIDTVRETLEKIFADINDIYFLLEKRIKSEHRAGELRAFSDANDHQEWYSQFKDSLCSVFNNISYVFYEISKIGHLPLARQLINYQLAEIGVPMSIPREADFRALPEDYNTVKERLVTQVLDKCEMYFIENAYK